ncbi:trimethylamine methyltransferase family protein [Candidatus Formimonas warabiya]|uniref:Trimethylamine methyltransferase n=1 Tax=Formimonas warabiya TaxID=1761012 RepID=A0A3G1KZQ6_FORW1|nr:trimethylamine methyltransferase family protein [Candidatus Formimonas warabiya]ATW28012.1 trimethylamine methyltransferase [Candidatus Formimonas warabiya]
MLEAVRIFNATEFQYLSQEQLQEIHSASLSILEDVGSLVYHEEALELLKKAGAYVENGNRVYIPGFLAEWAIRTAPSRVAIYDRNGKEAMFLEGRKVYYGTGSDCPNILDSFTGEKRKFLYKDVEDAVKICDYLSNIDFIMSMGIVSNVQKELTYQHEYAIMLRNSIKPQTITAADRASLVDIVEMAGAAVGGKDILRKKPIFVLYVEPSSPLQHSATAVEKLLYAAEHRLPVNYSPGLMAGATGPITMAGAMAQANAEILAGLVIHQLKSPGAPFVFGAGMSPMDLVSMQPTYCAPEAMMETAGICQLARYYHLPSWGFAGCSSSKLPDEHAVYEASIYILMAALTGSNLTHDVGYLEFGLTYSFDLLVMCNEIIGQVKRLMQGIPVDKEHLAVDAIRRVGPGGHFLGDEHTYRHFRDQWQPDLTDRTTYETWLAHGGTSMGQRTQKRIRDILENHHPAPLAPEVNREIDRIIARAEERTK